MILAVPSHAGPVTVPPARGLREYVGMDGRFHAPVPAGWALRKQPDSSEITVAEHRREDLVPRSVVDAFDCGIHAPVGRRHSKRMVFHWTEAVPNPAAQERPSDKRQRPPRASAQPGPVSGAGFAGGYGRRGCPITTACSGTCWGCAGGAGAVSGPGWK